MGENIVHGRITFTLCPRACRCAFVLAPAKPAAEPETKRRETPPAAKTPPTRQKQRPDEREECMLSRLCCHHCRRYVVAFLCMSVHAVYSSLWYGFSCDCNFIMPGCRGVPKEGGADEKKSCLWHRNEHCSSVSQSVVVKLCVWRWLVRWSLWSMIVLNNFHFIFERGSSALTEYRFYKSHGKRWIARLLKHFKLCK